MAENRRKFVRLDVDVKVAWEKIPSSQECIVTEDLLKNISQGGICFVTYNRLILQDQLKLCIGLPSGKIIQSTAIVVWIKEPELIGRKDVVKYDVGAEFLNISVEDKIEIMRFEKNPGFPQ